MNRPVNLDTYNSAGDELTARGDLSRRRFLAKTASTLSALSAPAFVGVGALTTASPAMAWRNWNRIDINYESARPLLQLFYPPSIADDDDVRVEISWRRASGSSDHMQASIWILRSAWGWGGYSNTIIDNPFFDYWESYGEVATTTIGSKYPPVIKQGGEKGKSLSRDRQLATFPWQASQDWMDRFKMYSQTVAPEITITGDTGVVGVQIVQYAFNAGNLNQVMYLVQFVDPVWGNRMFEGYAMTDSSINNLQNKANEASDDCGALNSARVYAGGSVTIGATCFALANTVLHSAAAAANGASGAAVGLACLMGWRYNNQYLSQWNSTMSNIRAAINHMRSSNLIRPVQSVERRYAGQIIDVPPTEITDLDNPLLNYVYKGKLPSALFSILFD